MQLQRGVIWKAVSADQLLGVLENIFLVEGTLLVIRATAIIENIPRGPDGRSKEALRGGHAHRLRNQPQLIGHNPVDGLGAFPRKKAELQITSIGGRLPRAAAVRIGVVDADAEQWVAEIRISAEEERRRGVEHQRKAVRVEEKVLQKEEGLVSR